MRRGAYARLAVVAVVLLVITTNLSGCPKDTLKVHSVKSVDQLDRKGVCFPADAVVIGTEGPKRMDEVQIGESLLGLSNDGIIVFTKVRGWLHRDIEGAINMTVLEGQGVRVTTSAQHYIATGPPGDVKYRFADDFKIGDHLLARDGSKVPVHSKGTEATSGLFSPMTSPNNFFVGSSADSVVLAHGFAHVPYPKASAWVLDRIMYFAEFMYGAKIHELRPGQKKYLHPVLRAVLTVVPLGVSVDTQEEPATSHVFPTVKGTSEGKTMEISLV